MKKIISILSMSLLLLSLTACGRKTESDNSVVPAVATNDTVQGVDVQTEETDDSAQDVDEQAEEVDDSVQGIEEQTEETDDSAQDVDEQTEETDDSAQSEGIEIEETEDEKLDRILVDLSNEIDNTRLHLLDELDTVYISLGYTHESYLENNAVLFDWCDLVQSETEQLCTDWVDKSKAYFELASSYIEPGDMDTWLPVIERYRASVSRAMDRFNEDVYVESFDDISEKYSNNLPEDWWTFHDKRSEVQDNFYNIQEDSFYDMYEFIRPLTELDTDEDDYADIFFSW